MATSFNPLPAHLKAVQEEVQPGASTPSYGGTVNTGAEWDFVRSGRSVICWHCVWAGDERVQTCWAEVLTLRSREPSRSPTRSAWNLEDFP